MNCQKNIECLHTEIDHSLYTITERKFSLKNVHCGESYKFMMQMM